MIGSLIWSVLVLVEMVFFGVRFWKKEMFGKQKRIALVSELLLFLLALLLGMVQWSFRWILLMLYLCVRTGIAAVSLLRKKEEKPYGRMHSIFSGIGSFILLTVVCLPAILFPQNPLPKPSGTYLVETKSFTWEDESRVETFLEDGSHRKVTVEFWYPVTSEEQKFPLVVFSHGAFGFRNSNTSTCEELASNGYVVCSIDHTYHACITRQTDGERIFVDRGFFNQVYQVNDDTTSEDEIFRITREWIKLREGDMNFVLDTIAAKVREGDKEVLFSKIDSEKTGLMGHSLGGATCVSVGRMRSDIDAVVDLDGTMLGEELACENGTYTINETPYDKPLLCMDTTSHYEEGLSYGTQYVNNVVLEHAIDAIEVHFNGAGHMDFTDLSLVCPILANQLEKSEANGYDCVTTMNAILLNYYNHYLKQSEVLKIRNEY